jgi:hypothetical protein
MDANTLAKSIVDQATGEKPIQGPKPKDAEMAAKGRAGGLVGGKARAARLSVERLSEIGTKGATVRWQKDSKDDSDMQ